TITDLSLPSGPNSFTTSYTVNIPAAVGGNVAYVGFGGGTGGNTAVQDILNWTFSTKDPGQPNGGAAVAQAPSATAAPAAGVLAAGTPTTHPASSVTPAAPSTHPPRSPPAA